MMIRQNLRDSARALWRAHVRYWARPLKLQSNDRLFVVSPHADDETLGAGGLIKRCRDLGIDVFVTCVNDGRFSHSEDLIDNKELIRLRREEFISSLELLGVEEDHLDFAGLDQAKMFSDTGWKDRLVQQIVEFKPTIIVLPDYMDIHEDHAYISREVSQLNLEAQVLYAPIWHIVYGPAMRPKPYIQALCRRAHFLDITNELSTKKQAWENYETQSSKYKDIEDWNFLDHGWSKHHMNKKEIFFTS